MSLLSAGKKNIFIFLILPLILSFILFMVALTTNIFFLVSIPVYFTFLSMLYGIIPAFYTTKNFFSLNGYENVVLK